MGSAGSRAPAPRAHVLGLCMEPVPTSSGPPPRAGHPLPSKACRQEAMVGVVAGPLQRLVEELLSGSPGLFGQMDRTDRLLPSHQGGPTPSPQGS